MNFTKMFVCFFFFLLNFNHRYTLRNSFQIRVSEPSLHHFTFHILNDYFANNFIIENKKKNMKKIEAKCQITNKIHAINVYVCVLIAKCVLCFNFLLIYLLLLFQLQVISTSSLTSFFIILFHLFICSIIIIRFNCSLFTFEKRNIKKSICFKK